MTWVSEQTKKEILELVRSSDLDQDGDFAIYDGREYYINVREGVVKPIIKHSV